METQYLGAIIVPANQSGDAVIKHGRNSRQTVYQQSASRLLFRVVFSLFFLLSLVSVNKLVKATFTSAPVVAQTIVEPGVSSRKVYISDSYQKFDQTIPARASASPVIELAVPMDHSSNTGFKAYMDYRTLTSKTSMQYKLQQTAYTNDAGFRMYDGCYMVALGTFYAQSAGERFRITLASGVEFDAITGDIKADIHTDAKHQHRNGNIVEFIVDTRLISRESRVRGDMSVSGFEGQVVSIQRILDEEPAD